MRGNPPASTSSATVLPLAREAHQFFLSGEPELADRYFPWLVNLMSPGYWVYLVMAVTVLFNLMNATAGFGSGASMRRASGSKRRQRSLSIPD